MGWDRNEALGRAMAGSDAMGRSWSISPLTDFDFDVSDPIWQFDAIDEAVVRVDLNEPEWEEERLYDDLGLVLHAHRLAAAMAARDHYVAADLDSRGELSATPQELRDVFWTSFVRHGLVREDSRISEEPGFAIRISAGSTIAELWRTYGGRDLPLMTQLAIVTLAELLTDAEDPARQRYFDADGNPARRYYGRSRRSIERLVYNGIVEQVTGQLPHPAPWPTLDYASLSEGIAERAAEIHEGSQRHKERMEEDAVHADAAAQDLALWQESHLAPQPAIYGITPEGAELWVRDWMLHMGAVGAEVTQLSGDGGIDVVANEYIAQVKLYVGPVGIAEIREFLGAASFDPELRTALFFTSGQYPQSAITLADEAGMALFFFDPRTGVVEGANKYGDAFVEIGFIGFGEDY